MLRQYQEEITKLKQMLDNRQSTPLKIEDLTATEDESSKENTTREELIEQYQTEMLKLKNLHENERTEKENILKQIEAIKEEYHTKLNEIKPVSPEKKASSKDDILRRLSTLKASLIGGERADDKELSERRKKKKLASERRLSAIAHVLVKIDMNEDREILQNQYKDISQELNLKTDALRKYRQKVSLY